MKLLALVFLLTTWSSAALAGLTEQQLGELALAPAPRAQVPMELGFKDIEGNSRSIGEAVGGRPALLLPVDFACSQICGPALTIVTGALQETGLTAGRDYSLVVFGIDARDDAIAARRFVAGQVSGPGVSVLIGNEAAIGQLTRSIGYHFQTDGQNDAIAHPAAFVTLTRDGHVSHAFSSLSLQPFDLRLGLLEAGRGTIGGLGGRIALLCYGFDAVHGVYTRQVAFALKLGCAFTLALLVAALVMMCRRSGRRIVA
jgi:protein SCO1/2